MPKRLISFVALINYVQNKYQEISVHISYKNRVVAFENLTELTLSRLLYADDQLIWHKGKGLGRHNVLFSSSSTNLSKVRWKFNFVEDASISLKPLDIGLHFWIRGGNLRLLRIKLLVNHL